MIKKTDCTEEGHATKRRKLLNLSVDNWDFDYTFKEEVKSDGRMSDK